MVVVVQVVGDALGRAAGIRDQVILVNACSRFAASSNQSTTVGKPPEATHGAPARSAELLNCSVLNADRRRIRAVAATVINGNADRDDATVRRPCRPRLEARLWF